MVDSAPPVKPAAPPSSPAPVKTAPAALVKELSPQERLEALLLSMRANYQHNAPISPGHIKELESIVAAGGGKVAVVTHDLAKHVLIAKPDGSVVVAYTAEDALDYVRSLPVEVRDLPYWVVAEKSLLAVIDSGGDTGAATTAFAAALAEDRKTAPVTRKPDELLPDGRIREDRFADRRPPAPPATQPAAQPAAT